MTLFRAIQVAQMFTWFTYPIKHTPDILSHTQREDSTQTLEQQVKNKIKVMVKQRLIAI